MRLISALLLILVPLFAWAQTNPGPRPDFSALRSEIQSRMKIGDVPGLSVAVALNGKAVWEEGFGWSDVEKHMPATANTRFYVASVTKTFTATALMRLKEDGKLQLDKPMNDYLGAAKLHSPKWNTEEATVRRVMSHTGGLTTFTHWCSPEAPDCKIDQDIAHYGVLVWPPGEVFDYSNLGYGALGEVVLRTSGQSLNAYFEKQIFAPLGMRNCGFDLPVARYDQTTHVRSPLKVTSHPGASGLYCSAHDLLLFGMTNLPSGAAHAVVNPTDLQELQRAQPATRDQYGMGWWLSKRAGYQLFSAQGGTTDAYASLSIVPGKDIAVVVLANSYSQFTSELSDRILSTILPETSTPPSLAAPTPASAAPASLALAGEWSGQILADGRQVSVVLSIHSDRTATAQIGSNTTITLSGVSIRPNHFYGRMDSVSGLVDDSTKLHLLELDLGFYEGELIGATTVGPPSGQDGDQFPYWVRLTRVKS